MERAEFEKIVAEAYEQVPEKFTSKVKNVALLVEDYPNQETLKENGVPEGGTLLGLYKGIPNTERGSDYGVGATLPDSITIYMRPILEMAATEAGVEVEWGEPTEPAKKRIRAIVRDTIWHEIAHYFGMDEFEIGERETQGTNDFKAP